MKHKLVRKVLMCKPLHFSVDYRINPWMQPGSIDKQQALTEWHQLVNVYKTHGIDVEVIDQPAGVPDMVFATDQGIVQDKTVLLSRFWAKERRGESKFYEAWFAEHGYQVKQLPHDIYLEGNGDTYFWQDKILIGTGFRANEATCKAVTKLLDREVIPLHIIDPKFYHLDIGFLPLNEDTAFYYPAAFSEESRGVLQKLVPNLLELSDEEAYSFAANSVVTDHHVIHQKNNPTFKQKLQDLGYTSVEVEVGEFLKSGGGIHCLTNVLEEAFEDSVRA